MDWQSLQAGARQKVCRNGSGRVRLLEISSEFVETQWCEKGHVGFVLQGELEVDFSGDIVRFPEGSALAIPAGATHAHKARGVTPVVRLFLVEDDCPEEESYGKR